MVYPCFWKSSQKNGKYRSAFPALTICRVKSKPRNGSLSFRKLLGVLQPIDVANWVFMTRCRTWRRSDARTRTRTTASAVDKLPIMMDD